MSEESPRFYFAPYHSYTIQDDGTLGAPFPAKSPNPDVLEADFIHVFTEADSFIAAVPWKCEGVYQAKPGSEKKPSYAKVIGTGGRIDQPEVGEEIFDGLKFPVSTSGGLTDRKYFFVVLGRMLDQIAIDEFCSNGPMGLPVASLKDGGQHFRYLMPDGELKRAPEAGATRLMMVVNPYRILQALCATYEWRADRPIRWTTPEAGYTKQERGETIERLARLNLARELEILRQGGVDVDEKLVDGGKQVSELLRDYDPTEKGGALAKMNAAREQGGRALAAYVTGPLFDLVDRDARLDDARARAFYAQHLDLMAQCLCRLPECTRGEELFAELERKFPPNVMGARKVPENAVEFVGYAFLFADPGDEQLTWKETVAVKAIRSLWKLHAAAATFMAGKALERLTDLTSLKPSAELASWAKLPLTNAAGLSAYRWAYHLRAAYDLERVEVDGVVKTVVWSERALGAMPRISTLDVAVNWDTGEWERKFGNGLDATLVTQMLSAVGLAFTVVSLHEALEHERGRGMAVLRTSAATLEFLAAPWVAGVLVRMSQQFATGRGVKVLRVAGPIGAMLNAFASVGEARTAWNDDGEGDVALAFGVSALGGALALSPYAAAMLGLAGPPGWVALGGLTLALGGGLIAALVKDSEVERMVDHCFFGTQPGAPHSAPSVALCASDNFAEWAASGEDSLAQQTKAFRNLTWAFGVRGQQLFREEASVELLPQRLLGVSAFHIEIEGKWGDAGRPAQLVHRGSVWLHVGEKSSLRVEHDKGSRFAASTVQGTNRSVLAPRANRAVIWTIGLADAAEVRGLELTELTLKIVLASHGKDEQSFFVPAGLPSDAGRQPQLKYKVVEANSSFQSDAGARGQSGQDPFLLNTNLALSTEAYS